LILINCELTGDTVIKRHLRPRYHSFEGSWGNVSSVVSPKFWETPNIFVLSEQQYFLWDGASLSTKRQEML